MHPLLLPVTIPLSWLYRVAVARRNARFDSGERVTGFDLPVISVGNISVGGTGKSPIVRWICDRLLEAGHRPVVAMRGYRSSASVESDEAMEYRDHFAGRVPVLAHPDRSSALRRFLPDHPEIDSIVLDDGFQHRFIARDLDLVLIDATQRTFEDRLLPAGRLREPPSALRRADGVIITHADDRDVELDLEITKHHGRAALAAARHAWRAVDVYESAASAARLRTRKLWRKPDLEPVHFGNPAAAWRHRVEAPTWLDGRFLVVCIGTGNPRAVERQVLIQGGMIRSRVRASDHQTYDARFIARLRKACEPDSKRLPHVRIDGLFITPKDWMKLRTAIDPADWPTRIIVPRLEIRFDQGGEALRDLILSTLQPIEAVV